MKTIPLLLAALFAPNVLAGTNVKLLVPATPVERGELRVRFEGPFTQPAPVLTLRIEGNRVIARSVGTDFAFPHLPQVAAVEAAILAPPAGNYVLVDERCAGNPPPPQGPCVEVGSFAFTVIEAHSVPTLSAWGAMLLAGLLLATRRLSASTAP